MQKKMTLEALAKLISAGFGATSKKFITADRKFAALAEDIAEMRENVATKGDIVAVAEQVTSIETQLRGMNHAKLQDRVADLEEEVFGKARG